MLKLMKYECYRKRRVFIVALVTLGIIEILLALSLFFLKIYPFLIPIPFILGTVILYGIYIYGFAESVMTFSNDVNKKKSYMLFLTPMKCHQFISTRLIVSTLQIIILSILALLFFYIDITITSSIFKAEFHEVWLELSISFKEIFSIYTPTLIIITLISFIMQWIYTVLLAYLSILLRKTIFADMKLGWAMSITIFIVISTLLSILTFIFMMLFGYLRDLNKYISNIITSDHIDISLLHLNKYMIIGLILSIVLNIVLFYICNKLLKSKVDL